MIRTAPNTGPPASRARQWPVTARPAVAPPRGPSAGPGPSAGARRLRAAVAACALAVLAAGCGFKAIAAPSVELTSAYVPQPKTPGVTSAYLDIRNNGAPDRLVAARASVGGQIALRVPQGHGMAMQTVPQIAIPSGSTVRLLPNGMHLLITGATGRMTGGKDITLTLTFAHAGTMSVPAMVTNPETGGGSYFTN